MLKNKLVAVLLFFVVGLGFVLTPDIAASAKEEILMGAGISAYLNPMNLVVYEMASVEEALCINTKYQLEQQRIGEEFAMANVQKSLNIRAEADESSEKVGVLYKDCGGIILDRVPGWIKIKSGDLIGWAKEEFMLTGEEAQAMADDVGNWLATIDTDTVLRVREEPGLKADTLGYIAYDDGLTIIEIINEDWVSVDYEGEVGYVATEFISVTYHIDEGETIEVIKAREAAEAEKRRTANRGRLDATADEVRLLGALIYCEAGNQSYDGKVGVGAVVMNRVRSGAYPNTIHGVIYASGQFPPALNGKVARIYENGVPASCLQAAQAAINGETTVGGATRFNRNNGKREGIVIGAHIFW